MEENGYFKWKNAQERYKTGCTLPHIPMNNGDNVREPGFWVGKMEENGDFKWKNEQKMYKTGCTLPHIPMNNGDNVREPGFWVGENGGKWGFQRKGHSNLSHRWVYW